MTKDGGKEDIEFAWTQVCYPLAMITMLTDCYGLLKNSMRLSGTGAEWTSVNDGSYQFLLKVEGT